MIYEVMRPFFSWQKEREKKWGAFYAYALDYLTKNKEDLQREVKRIPIYEGPLMDVEQRIGKRLEGIELKGPEQFLSCRDTFWLLVEAARVGRIW